MSAREVRSFLDQQWDPELSLREWRERLVDAGWACPTWPIEWHGRGLSAADASVVATRSWRPAACPGPPAGVGLGLAAPTILEHGSDDVKRRFLRPIATGAHRVVPAVQRAGLRVGPRRARDPRRPRRRRVGRQRSEAVEHERPPRRVRPARRPHRLGRAEAPRPHVLRDRHAPARRRGAPGAPDERACLVQRGVPHRCEGARRRHHRRSRRGLAGGPRRRWPTNGGSTAGRRG